MAVKRRLALYLTKWTLLAFLMAMSSVLHAYESIAISEWKIQVVDDQGKPVAGATVLETWRNWAFESNDHEFRATSDKNGFVVFPASKVSGHWLRRLFGPAILYFSYDLHGPPRFESRVEGWQENRELKGEFTYLGPPQPLPTQLVLHALQTRERNYNQLLKTLIGIKKGNAP